MVSLVFTIHHFCFAVSQAASSDNVFNTPSGNWNAFSAILLSCRLQMASSSALNDRDAKDSRSDHAAVGSHGSALKEADAKQRQLERNARDRAAEHLSRGHPVLDRDDGRRDGIRRPSESESLHRQERRHSGSHHHHHHHHHQPTQQQHGSAKDDAARHNRQHAGTVAIVVRQKNC